MAALYFRFPNDDDWYVENNLILPGGNIPRIFGANLETFYRASDIIIEQDDGLFSSYKDRQDIFRLMKGIDFFWMKLRALPFANR
jgi:hypothetical protein